MKLFKIKLIFQVILLMLALSINTCKAQGAPKAENSEKKDWQGILEIARSQTEYDASKKEKLIQIIAEIIKDLLSLLGVIFIVFTLYAGYLWMTAGGNDENVSKAKMIIKNSVTGLVITLSAYAITYFIMKNVINIAGDGVEQPGYYIKLKDDTGD